MKLNSSLFFLSFTHERGTGSRAVSRRSGERKRRAARPCSLWLALSPAEWLSDQPGVWALPDAHRWGVWVIGENRFCSSTAVSSLSSEPYSRKQHFFPCRNFMSWDHSNLSNLWLGLECEWDAQAAVVCFGSCFCPWLVFHFLLFFFFFCFSQKLPYRGNVFSESFQHL